MTDHKDISEFKDTFEKPVTKVIGVGASGIHAVNHMIASGLRGVVFIAADACAGDLAKSQAEHAIQLGPVCCKGLNTEADPDAGRRAAEESLSAIKAAIGESDLVFVVTGMGGGTGTGAFPVIAKAAKDAGALTVGVASTPFYFEGKKRLQCAEAGMQASLGVVDSLISIPNNWIRIQLNTKYAIFYNMLQQADETLYYAVKGVSDVVTREGLIGVDFADVRCVFTGSGAAVMGIGTASGENRARDAAIKATTCRPLLNYVSIDKARSVLINITCSRDITATSDELRGVVDIIREAVHEDTDLIVAYFEDSMGDKMRVTLFCAGIQCRDLEGRLALS